VIIVRWPVCDTRSADREVRQPTPYDHAMSLFRNVMNLFRGGAGKERQQAATEPLQAAAEPVKVEAMTVEAQPAAARREVKREARPNPNKPGWGSTLD